MRPNPFLLGPLCLALIAAILLINRATPGQATPAARPLIAAGPAAVAPAQRPAHRGQHAWRDAGEQVSRLLDSVRRASVRPTVQHDLTRLSRWTTGRAGAARGDITRTLGAARTRANGAVTALRRLGTRVQDGRRGVGLALGVSLRRAGLLGVSLRRAEAGIQDRARAIGGAMRVVPWSH